MVDYRNFKLTKNPIKKDNPELTAIPELDRLTERQLRYVFLVDWFKTPLRLMELESRKQKAALLAGYKLEKDGIRLDINGRNLTSGKVGNVEAARKVMREIQYDEDREMFSGLNEQILDIVTFLRKKGKTTVELEKATKMAKELPALVKARKELIEILDYREPFEENSVTVGEDDFEGSEKASLLEEFLDEED